MNRIHPPSGLQREIEVLIDPHWSPEQAMAVIELLDDLRDRIWAHYDSVLRDTFRDDRVTHRCVEISDPPF